MNIIPTGDGMSTAVQIANVYVETPELFTEIEKLKIYSQITESIDVYDKSIVNNAMLEKLVLDINEKLGSDGRAFVRASGTEPKVRATVETKDENLTKKYLQDIVSCIKNLNNNL